MWKWLFVASVVLYALGALLWACAWVAIGASDDFYYGTTGMREGSDSYVDLIGLSTATAVVASRLAAVGAVCIGAGIALSVVGFVAAYRARGVDDRKERLSKALDHLIDGLADAEREATHTAAELIEMRREQERLKALATLSPDQLEAISESVAPGARRAFVWSIAFGVLGIVTWLISLGVGNDLPWQ